MEISDIQNWNEVQQQINNIIQNITSITTGTERDIYIYFQSIREMNERTPIICPYCEKKFSQIEVGLSPQKTMDDWDRDKRTEPNAMSFEDFRQHMTISISQEMVRTILSIRQKPTAVEQNMLSLQKSITTLGYISQRIHTLSETLKSNTVITEKDLIDLMTDTLEDIRKSIAQLN